MKEVVPNYYHKFKCIADRCTHNCCIGWEIDIDEETLVLYNSLDTALGERIRKNIEGDVPHFVLQKDDRCPFLNERGLCEIICEYGEDALCDICFLHPRFTNYYHSFAEIGLGLCCEEAVRIILSSYEKFSIELPKDITITDEEKLFFKRRQEILGVLQDRERSIGQRYSDLAREFGFEFGFSVEKLCNTYLSLERLDEKWTFELDNLKGFSFDRDIFEETNFQIFFEQLSVYFIFRHLGKAICDGDYVSKVRFALMGCYLIGALCSHYKYKHGNVTYEQIAEYVRMYSAEVEYSEVNTDALLKCRVL